MKLKEIEIEKYRTIGRELGSGLDIGQVLFAR
jgi:hypothetical protein